MSFFKGWIILILCIYRIFCIHWSITGRLGYFHILAVVTVLQWTWEYGYLFEILLSILLDKYPEVGWLDHMVVLLLILWETPVLFFIEAVPFYIPTKVYNCSNFFTSSPTVAIFFFFFFWLIASLTVKRWYFIVVLICISPIGDIEHLFVCLLAWRALS